MTTLGGRARIAMGALVWALLLYLASAHFADPAEGRDRRALAGLRSYLFGSTVPVYLRFPEDVEIGVGDPVFLQGVEGSLLPMGEVRSLRGRGGILALAHAFPGDGVREAECLVRTDVPAGPIGELRAKLTSVPQDASWVLRTLLPPEKLKIIMSDWNDTLLQHREEIFGVLGPVLEATLRDIREVLAADLPRAVEARRPELTLLGERLHAEIVKAEFEPLAQTELWPIVQRRAQPTLQALSEEVWNRLPLWGFTWRFFYQSLPLTADDHLKKEMDRFWREETVPILKAHVDDFLGIFQDIVKEAARNPRVGEAFRRSFERLLADQDLQRQFRLIFQEVILDNPRFQEAMARRWSSPEVMRAVDVLFRRLEPLVRRIGDLVLGTRRGGITREFARVLRTQILMKDRRWVLLERTGGPQATLQAPLEGGSVIQGEVERP